MSKDPFEYHKPTEDQVLRMSVINDYARGLYNVLLENAPHSRERSLAITKLQEARMWANASIVFEEAEG